MPYRHLTLEERRALFRLLDAKVPVAEIAKRLGRHRATIYCEIRRNLFRDVKEHRGYHPITADDNARRRRQRRRKPIRDARLRQHVIEKLWSPERIAGRLELAGGDARSARSCHETVRRFVASPEGRALALRPQASPPRIQRIRT